MTGVVAQLSISPGGVPNRPIDQGHATAGGIQGDGWRHPQIHGIPKRAILLITAEGVDSLIARGFPVFYGALGENLTTRGLERRDLRIGQRFHVGSAVIQLTEVRFPCGTLNRYGASIQSEIYDKRTMSGDPESPVWGMSGFYASVIQPGLVRPGDAIQLLA